MLNIVLYEPLIPQNTGNIIRTCVGVDAKLHLIEPLGFKLDDKYLKRSGLDYFHLLDFKIYPNFEQFLKENNGYFFFLTRYGKHVYSDINYNEYNDKPIYFIFGKETTGVDRPLLADNMDKTFRIPTNDKIRSLNLSNTVNIVVFEYLRQLDFPNLSKEEPETLKGKDYLNQFIK